MELDAELDGGRWPWCECEFNLDFDLAFDFGAASGKVERPNSSTTSTSASPSISSTIGSETERCCWCGPLPCALSWPRRFSFSGLAERSYGNCSRPLPPVAVGMFAERSGRQLK